MKELEHKRAFRDMAANVERITSKGYVLMKTLSLPFALPVQMFGLRSAGLVSGFGNFFANLGGFTFVYVLGAVKDATGSFQSGFAALSVACVVSLGATAYLGRLRSRRVPGR